MSLTNKQNQALKILKNKIENKDPVSILQGFAGVGKALRHGTKIPTPTGYVNIEDLKIGDLVFSEKGTPTKIKAIHPQGAVDLFKITFDDGRESICCGNHQWSCFTSKGNLKTFKTKDMLRDFKLSDGRPNHYRYKYKIPNAEAVEYESQDYKVDPYVFGAFLGDGNTRQPELSLSSENEIIPQLIAEIIGCEVERAHKNNFSWVFFNGRRENGTRKRIQAFDFFQEFHDAILCHSYEKRIPDKYKFGSIEQRFSLVQGLFDTDGSVSEARGRVTFCSTSNQLILDLQEVLYSLGIKNKVTVADRAGRLRPEYTLYVQTSIENKKRLFRLERKLQRVLDYEKSQKAYAKYNQVTIRNIIPYGSGLATCIEVENESHLFLTEDFIVTHNSYTLGYLIQELNLQPSQIVFTAFTGAATRILQQKGLNAQTIHSLIYTPIIRRGVCIGFNKVSPMELAHLRLIIVDEFSMVSNDIMQDLLSFNIPLLLVGDSAQLPSLGEPNPYLNKADAFLDEVMRQALDNPVLWAATQIRENKLLPEGVHGDILFVGRRLQMNEDWLRKDVQTICGLNNTRNSMNLKIKGSPQVAVGDKVIFLRNDWKQGVVNGTIAELTQMRKLYNSYKLGFNDDMGKKINNYCSFFQTAPTKRDQIFDWAYAITAHKAQGATFDCPGLIIDESGAFKEYKTNWLYVALTRFTGNYKVALLR